MAKPTRTKVEEAPAPRAVVRVGQVKGMPPSLIAVYGDGDELLALSPVERGRAEIELPDRYAGRPVRVLFAPHDPAVERPSIERLRRRLAHEELLILRPDIRLEFDPNLLIPRWRLSCCRVRGRVFTTVHLPDGTTSRRPLCNARVVICEVDRSFIRVIETLPVDVLYRLRAEWRAAIAAPPHGLMGGPADEVLRAGLEVTVNAAGEAQSNGALGARVAAATKLTGSADLRAELIDLRHVLRPYWQCFDWLRPFYNLDCVATVDVAENGTFDTEIFYPCYGDRPDLYFKVEQDCHPGGWLVVHAPPVHCNTHWDYCCGDSIDIEVTHPAAVPGRSPTPCPGPFVAGDPASVGAWETLPYISGVFVVHAALLPTGKVLLFSGTAEANLPKQSRVWDPATGTMTTQPFGDDLFCAGHALLADGRILVNGGSANPGQGIRSTHIFDPVTETWAKVQDMAYPRWYPTSLTLPDGRVLTFSGRGGEATIEVYDPSADDWTELTPAVPRALEIYPSVHLMPDGKVLYTGTRWAGSPAWPSPPASALFDPVAVTWTDVDDHVVPNRTEGTSIQLPPLAPAPIIHEHEDVPKPPAVPPTLTRVLVVGGSGDNPGDSKSAEIIDLADAAPAWRRIADCTYSRVNTNGVILPDGTVLICAGIDGYKWGPNTPSLAAELFDPQTETWTVMASMSVGRQYHSVSVLLADGRVLNTGSVGPGGNNLSMEVYSPPYLFRGPRPPVSACPAVVGYGVTFTVSSPAACRIEHVAMVRCTTITHHTNTDQRYLPLAWHRHDPCDLTITSPANAQVAPPGYYLLFLLDDCDVPSVGRLVRLA